MILIREDILSAAGKKNVALRRWLADWVETVEEADWASLDDVRKQYPSADGVRLSSRTVVTVFNVKGNSYRLLAWIDYRRQIVEVLEVITHAEYDKDLWKARY